MLKDMLYDLKLGAQLKWIVVILAVVIGVCLGIYSGGGCTANQRAKQWGGVYKVTLPCGQKLTFATWKENNLWYTMRPFRSGESAETTTMLEDSDYGVMKGKVIFTECQE